MRSVNAFNRSIIPFFPLTRNYLILRVPMRIKLPIFLSAALLGLFALQCANAATVTDLLFFNAQNKISDNSAEFLVNRVDGTATLEVGDVLITNFTIASNENLSASGTNT